MLCSSAHSKLLNVSRQITALSKSNKLLENIKNYCAVSQQKSVSLQHHLYHKISTTGPISVAEFMKSVLTNPHAVSITNLLCCLLDFDIE